MNYGQVRCRVGEMRRDHNTEGVVTKEVGKIGDTTTSLGDHRIWGVCTRQNPKYFAGAVQRGSVNCGITSF